MVLEDLVTFIVGTVGDMGYLGIVFMMFLESSFFPFPSEVVITPAGYLASRGEMSLPLVVGFGILGSILGALFNYWLAAGLGRPVILRYGRYVGLTEGGFSRVERYFEDHGEISTFVGRLIPGIRQYISFPAGLGRMNVPRFCFYTGLGAGIWVTLLAVIGYVVGSNQELVEEYIHRSLVIILFFVVFLLYFYYWAHKRKKLS